MSMQAGRDNVKASLSICPTCAGIVLSDVTVTIDSCAQNQCHIRLPKDHHVYKI